jgi:hypothetical protein
MMRPNMKALIRWLTREEGGRERPPVGPTYSTVARFSKLYDRWPDEAWSVVLDIAEPADENNRMLAGIRMLVEDAPAELLVSGSEFELYEGRKCVARGAVQ